MLLLFSCLYYFLYKVINDFIDLFRSNEAKDDLSSRPADVLPCGRKETSSQISHVYSPIYSTEVAKTKKSGGEPPANNDCKIALIASKHSTKSLSREASSYSSVTRPFTIDRPDSNVSINVTHQINSKEATKKKGTKKESRPNSQKYTVHLSPIKTRARYALPKTIQ